jgi:WD repeat-containing protein 61
MFSCLSKVQNAHEEAIWACTLADSSLLTGSVDGTINIWSPELEKKTSIPGHLGVISLDAKQNIAISNSLENSINVWDNGKLLKSISANPVESWKVRLSPDAKHFITGTHSGNVVEYSIDGEVAGTTETKGKFIMSVAYSPDGKLIAAGGQEGHVYVINRETKKILHTFTGHSQPVRALVFSVDSSLLICGCDDKRISVYDVQSGNSVAMLSGHSSWVLGLDVNLDGIHFASCSSDKRVKIWSLSSRQCVHTFEEHEDQVWDLKFNADGTRLFSVGEDATINLYQLSL